MPVTVKKSVQNKLENLIGTVLTLEEEMAKLQRKLNELNAQNADLRAEVQPLLMDLENKHALVHGLHVFLMANKDRQRPGTTEEKLNFLVPILAKKLRRTEAFVRELLERLIFSLDPKKPSEFKGYIGKEPPTEPYSLKMTKKEPKFDSVQGEVISLEEAFLGFAKRGAQKLYSWITDIVTGLRNVVDSFVGVEDDVSEIVRIMG